jgi:hypothetical protein
LSKSFVLASASLITLAAIGAATGAVAATPPDRPMFLVQPNRLHPNIHTPSGLPTWNFSFTYAGKTYTDQFVGTDPTGGAKTTIPVYIIPIELNLKGGNGGVNTDPLATLSNGNTVVQNIIDSPIFDKTTNYTQGGTNVGTTQYEDAVQRASLWGTVSGHTNYHVLLGTPRVKALKTFTVPKADGKVTKDFGVTVLNVDINWLDPKLEALLTALHIPANSLPIFVTTQVYLTSSGCCIGGYHSYTGTQAYSEFTYIQTPGAFSQDVSALSHEAAEWMNDPETNNNSPCGLYEVGDPLEGTADYGTHPYTVNGFTYHLQDIVMPPYFGAPGGTSVNSWYTFDDYPFTEVCAKGP